MTYIAGLYCKDGVVLSSDTQETIADQKVDVEKLYVVEDQQYPLALGGAGLGEAIDAFAQELSARVVDQQPTTIRQLKTCISGALKENHERDAATSEWPIDYRKAQYLIAAKPKNDKFVLLRVQGKRIYQVKRHALIGSPTAANRALLRRMYREMLPMQQAVMLAVYAVSQSKEVDAYVGGQPQVAVVVDNGAWLDDPEYIAQAELRIGEFMRQMDDLFLASIDVSISPTDFSEKLEQAGRSITMMRNAFIRYSAARTLDRTFRDPNYRGDPYPKLFPRAVTDINGNFTVNVREETAEEVEKRRKIFEAMKKDYNQLESGKFVEMVAGRQALYIGEEKIQVCGTAGPVPESDNS